MPLRLTVPVWDVHFLIVRDAEKSGSAARPPEVQGKARALNPASLSLLPICPSQWTAADERLEGKMDGACKQTTHTKKWGKKWNNKTGEDERKRDRENRESGTYGCTHRLRQSDRWEDYGAGIFSTVVEVRKPPLSDLSRVSAALSGGWGQNPRSRKYPPFPCNISLHRRGLPKALLLHNASIVTSICPEKNCFLAPGDVFPPTSQRILLYSLRTVSGQPLHF